MLACKHLRRIVRLKLHDRRGAYAARNVGFARIFLVGDFRLDHATAIGSPADQLPQRLAHNLPVQIPERRLERSARQRMFMRARAFQERIYDLAWMRVRARKHAGNQFLAKDALVLVKRLWQIPVRRKCDALRYAGAAFVVGYPHQKRFALFERRLRRVDRRLKRLLHAENFHPLHANALFVRTAERRTVHFADTGARKLLHHQDVFGQIHLRKRPPKCRFHAFRETLYGRFGSKALVGRRVHSARNGRRQRMRARERAVCALRTKSGEATCRPRRKTRTHAQISQVAVRIAQALFARAKHALNRLARSARRPFHDGNRTAPPCRIEHAEHVRIRHPWHEQELALNFRRIDVLSTGHEHVVSALGNLQRPSANAGAVPCQEIAVHGKRSARIQVACAHARPADRKLPHTVGIGRHHGSAVARQ